MFTGRNNENLYFLQMKVDSTMIVEFASVPDEMFHKIIYEFKKFIHFKGGLMAIQNKITESQ